jgi:hypothetical protein
MPRPNTEMKNPTPHLEALMAKVHTQPIINQATFKES